MTDSKVLEELWTVITDHANLSPDKSYTAKILKHRKGIDKSLEKLGEETTEYILAVKNEKKEDIVYEGADVIYHFLLTLKSAGITPSDIYQELERRRK